MWTLQTMLAGSGSSPGDSFGSSVALSVNTLLVGAPNADKTGAAYLYARSSAAWSQQAKVKPTDRSAGADFGYSVALNGDTALVGSWGNGIGAAYVYHRSANTWTEEAELRGDPIPFQNFRIAVALTGGTALVGANTANGYTGGVYVFDDLPSPANLTVSPSVGAPFTRLTLSGSGFSPNETVGLAYVTDAQTPLGTAVADGVGSFNLMVSLPLIPHASGLIDAIGISSGLEGPRTLLSRLN